MAVNYLVQYGLDENGQTIQDLTLEFTDADFVNGTIGDFRFTDAYNSYQWVTFTSVAFEPLSQQDIDLGFGGMLKITASGRSTDNANMVFFIENPSNMGEDGLLNLYVYLLSPDWSTMWFESGLYDATYMPQWVYHLSSFYGFDANAGAIDYQTGVGPVDESNTSLVTDEGRTAVQFDGDGYIRLGDPSTLALNEWSIFLWVKTSVDSGRQDFLAQWYDNDGLYPSIDLGTVDGVLKAYYRGANNGSINALTGPSIADGQWHSVAFVKEATEVVLFVDGVQVAVAAFSGIIDSDSDLYIGAWNGELLGHPMDHHFDGLVDDLHLYSRAMSSTEVATHHTFTTIAPQPSVSLDFDTSTVAEGDTLSTTLDLLGGTLTHFAWEAYDADGGYWVELESGFWNDGTGVDLLVIEDHSERIVRVAMEVDGAFYFSDAFTMPAMGAPAGPYTPTEPTVQVTFFGSDSYGDAWNNGEVTITSADGSEVFNTSGPAYGIRHPEGVTEAITLSSGATYTVQVLPGQWPTEIAATITSADGTELLAVTGESGTVTFDAPTAEAGGDSPPLDGGGEGEEGEEGEEADWTFGGQLSDIVKVVKGQDASGAMSMMYLKNNAGSTDVYISPTVSDFAAFTLMASAETGFVGYPVSGEYGFGGCFVLGTSEGNVYKIQVGSDGFPSSSELIHAFGAGSVSSVSYSSSTQEWLMEHDGAVYTMPYAGGAAEMKMSLPAGSKVVDFAVGPDGVAMTLQMADFSLAAYIAGPDWSQVNDPSTMSAVLTAIGASDFNYFADVGMWIAAAADGTFVTTDDISSWLQ